MAAKVINMSKHKDVGVIRNEVDLLRCVHCCVCCVLQWR